MPEPVKMRLLENPTLTYGQVITTARQLLAAHATDSAYRGGGSILGSNLLENVKKEPEPNVNRVAFQNRDSGPPVSNWRNSPGQFRFQNRNNFVHYSNTTNRNFKCFNCGRFGHIARNCRMFQQSYGGFQNNFQNGRSFSRGNFRFSGGPRKGDSNIMLHCLVCGDPGHNAGICEFGANVEQNEAQFENLDSVPVDRGISVGPSLEYTLDGRVDDVRFSILLDSGASRSFMNYNQFESKYPGRNFKERGQEQRAKGPVGDPIVVKGSVLMKVRIGNFE